MTKNKNRYLLTLGLLISILLTGCFGQKTPEENIYEILENVAGAEEIFERQQDPIVDLERKEKELYNAIISLGMKDYDQIVTLSDEAIENIAKRTELMKNEQNSIKASEQEFEKIVPLISKVDDPDLKKKANELAEVMNKRYDMHDELSEFYLQGLKFDKELYEMFKDKDISMEQLEKQVNRLNETYGQLMDVNEQFNQFTKSYNETKLSFYKQAGLYVNTKNK